MTPFWSRLVSWSRPSASSHSRRAGGFSPTLEVMEDRLTPSGGSGGGGGGGSGGGGGGSGSGGGGAILTSTSGSGSSSGSGKAFKLDDNAAPIATGALLSELFSGYPLPPSLGPGLKGDML